MTYPTIPQGNLETAVNRLRDDATSSVDDLVKFVGRGPELELPEVDLVAAAMKERHAEFISGDSAGDFDGFEGRESTTVFDLLSQLETHVLDDPAFWSYLSLCHFWWLVHWREQSSFEKEPSKWLLYIDGRRATESVLSRMYLRGQIATAAGDPALAAAVPQATDFWRSHITRVSTGYVPVVAGALIRHQADNRMATNELRSYAKRLNRLSTNLLLDLYDDESATKLIEELRES